MQFHSSSDQTFVMPGDTSATKIDIAKSDPYFLWAVATDSRSVVPVLGRQQQPKPSAGLPAAEVVPQEYLQVLIEVHPAGLSEGDRTALVAKFLAFVNQVELRIRGAYFVNKHRFVTALVRVERLPEFVRGIGAVAVRFEMGHANTSGAISNEADDDEAVPPLQKGKDSPMNEPLLTGKVMAVVDYGCPFARPSFRSATGALESRVRYVWFQGFGTQTMRAELPRAETGASPGFYKTLFPYGRELRGSRIDAILQQFKGDERACYESLDYELMREYSTHGGHVLDIAAGYPNPLAEAGDSLDDAAKASIIFVQLPRQAVGDSSGGAMNVHVVDALRYIAARCADTADVVINLSFGTHAGPHDGTSMLESAIDDIIDSERKKKRQFDVVIPAGNSFNAACHAAFTVAPDLSVELEWEVMPDDPSDSFVEFWYGGDAPIAIEVMAPDDNQYLQPVGANQIVTWKPNHLNAAKAGDTSAICCTAIHVQNATNDRKGEPVSHVALVAVSPTRNRPGGNSKRTLSGSEPDIPTAEAPYGVWKFRISTISKNGVAVNAWAERNDAIFDPPATRQSRFVVGRLPDDQDQYIDGNVTKLVTFNSYATAQHVDVAGAVVRPSRRTQMLNPATGAYVDATRPATYSAAGPKLGQFRAGIAPNFVAYSEDSEVLLGRNAAGSTSRASVRRNGTSVTAPQVARALLDNAIAARTAPSVGLSSDGSRGDGLSKAGVKLQDERGSQAHLIV